MKKLFTAIAVSLIAFAASAQQNAEVSLTIPATIAAATTTNVAQVIDVTKQASAGVQFTFALVSAGTNGPVTLKFSRSNDRSQWTTSQTSVGITANGTTAVSILTNIPSYGARYIRLDSVQNGEGVIVTNTACKYSLKVGAP